MIRLKMPLAWIGQTKPSFSASEAKNIALSYQDDILFCLPKRELTTSPIVVIVISTILHCVVA